MGRARGAGATASVGCFGGCDGCFFVNVLRLVGFGEFAITPSVVVEQLCAFVSRALCAAVHDPFLQSHNISCTCIRYVSLLS